MSGKTDAPLTIVIIDDDNEHLHLMQRALKDSASGAILGYPRLVKTYSDPTEALLSLPADGRVAVLCDYQMPGGNGLDWLPDLTRSVDGPIIMLSSQGDEHIAAHAFKAGASDYLVKADVFRDPKLLHISIRDALRRYNLERCNRELASELKRANAALENKNHRLRELTETAHRFVEDVAHEFRTPLTVIKEFASIIRDGLGGPVTDKQADFLGYIDSSVRDLTQLIEDFLDTSKLKSKMLRVDRRPYTVEQIFEPIRRMLETRAESKQIRIIEEIDERLPMVYCDREKIGRVLINLVVNAIKYSPDGSKIWLWSRISEQGDVKIGITDEGPGFEQNELEKICERFRQTDTNQRSSVKGFGLGLNIASNLIRLNLGVMDITTAREEGSTFAFILPYYEPIHVINRYAEYIANDMDEVDLTVLQVRPADDRVTTSQLRQFLTVNTRSMDFVLEMADETALVVLGPTNQPDQWIASLNAKWASWAVAEALPDLNIRWHGTWECPAMKDALVASVSDRLLGVRTCA